MKAASRIERLRTLLDQTGNDAIIVRDLSDLRWLTGFERVFDTEQAHTAVVTHDSFVLHTDSRYSAVMGQRAQEEGIVEIHSQAMSVGDFVAEALSDAGLSSGRVIIAADMPLNLYRSLSQKLPDAELVERFGDIVVLRAVKEPAEIELMKRVQAIASEAFMSTLKRAQIGMQEREFALELEFQMRKLGADELSFSSIVASGLNGANPHAIPSERKLSAGDLVVIDFGARVDGYCSDTTRTVCVGDPAEEQQRMYDAVLTANRQVRQALKPGVTGAQMHALAEEVLAQCGYANLMGHGLGHGVGIDIHEQPNLSPRNPAQLVEGNVVTDEPGVYIAGFAGVRIEDCGVITADGFDNFCELPHEMLVIE